ncbi:hypothetical protein SCHPADRAFT_904299 [Schizopora paradoxa]|uniref:Uncharacterized protein n=1 Tax=Schizopora paradoxa TaxID=27342 RepID=A0A0H2RN83_9AGAM|nr:hypothetical protein SCHPADRAFT_904299 [Schizopora paradoxa]
MSTTSDPSIKEPKESVENADNVPSIPSTVESEEGSEKVGGGTSASTATDDKGVTSESEQKELNEGEDEDEDDEDEDEDEDDEDEPSAGGDDAVVYPRRFIPKGRPNKQTAGKPPGSS